MKVITRAVKLPVPNLQYRELGWTGRAYRKKTECQEALRVTTLGIQSSGTAWQPQFIIAKIETTDEHP